MKNKMSSIRNSMVFFSVSIILLMALLSLYTLGIMNRYKDQVSTMFENHIYLKNIENQMNALDENLLGYLTTKSSTKLNDYLIGVDALEDEISAFNEDDIEHNELYMKNVFNLIDQYQVEADLAITFKRQRNVNEYYKHYEKSQKIQGFVFEYILQMNKQQIETNSIAYLELLNQTRLLQTTTNVIILDLIILSMLIVYVITSNMVKPINALYKSAEEISEGNFKTEDIIIDSDNEYRMLAEAFNKMKNNIVLHIDTLKLQAEMEAELKDEHMKNLKMTYLLERAKLSALQSQINPHFLFNTINAGVQLSVIENASKTGHFLETMSRLFRYNMRMQQDYCTLEDEIRNIKDYYELLIVRFRDRIQFEFIVEPETMMVLMPPMILQPIVENSYIHGLSSLEQGGKITIISQMMSDYVEVIIKDNGVGMSEKIIHEIMKKSESENIGVRNVRERLELYYHQENLFDIKNSDGVEVTIKLPIEVNDV